MTDVLLLDQVQASKEKMMKIQMSKWNAMFGFLAVMVVFSGGCGQATNDGGSEQNSLYKY